MSALQQLHLSQKISGSSGPTELVTDSWLQSSGSLQDIATYGSYSAMEGGMQLASGVSGVQITGGTYNTSRRTNVSPNADQYSQIVITANQISNSVYCGPAVRCQTGANTSYHVETSGGGNYYLSKCVAGSQTTLDGPISATFAAGDVLRLTAEGSGATVSLKVWKAAAASPTSFTQIGTTYSDTASDRITGAGQLGIFGYGNTTGTPVIGTWAAGNL